MEWCADRAGRDGVDADIRSDQFFCHAFCEGGDEALCGGVEHRAAAAAVRVGAFALPDGSKDCALLLYLAPGSYTAQISGVANTTGVALVEVYEVP